MSNYEPFLSPGRLMRAAALYVYLVIMDCEPYVPLHIILKEYRTPYGRR